MLTIHQLAAAANVTVSTVRFLQRSGLLENSPSQFPRRRYYSQQHVLRVQFIRRAQPLGFSLEKIQEHLMTEGPQWCGEMRALANAAWEGDQSDHTQVRSK